VYHYHLAIDESEVYDLMSKDQLKGKDKMLFEFFTGHLPTNLDYRGFIADIESVGYKKQDLGEDERFKIDSIFCTRHPLEIEANSCIAEYRDVLVFMKNKKITGIAKICFQCEQWDMVGTVISPENFGQSGEFTMLRELLKH
jgi:hypothetical protein